MNEEWYYCIEHGVEPKVGCQIFERLGPYPTREAASEALKTVEERNKRWDDDPDWNDEDDEE